MGTKTFDEAKGTLIGNSLLSKWKNTCFKLGTVDPPPDVTPIVDIYNLVEHTLLHEVKPCHSEHEHLR